MNVLVTGAAGFIASHLVPLLDQMGVRDLRLLDSRNPSYLDQIRASFFLKDLTQIGEAPEILEGVDVVFHLAWASVPESSTEAPVSDVASSLIPTVELLQQCVRHRIKRVVFLSTGGAVYGIPKQLPISEDHPTDPISAYGVSKLAAERYLALFHHLYGLEYAILRPSVAYGEYQSLFGKQGAIAVFIGKILKQYPISIWGDPNSITRDFIYVGDLARACILAARSAYPTGVYNLGTGKGVSLAELINMLAGIVGPLYPIQVETYSSRPFDVPNVVLDISRADTYLGWQPETDLASGLRLTWQWAKEQDWSVG
jgi:UDP-glucose 4-epimerase